MLCGGVSRATCSCILNVPQILSFVTSYFSFSSSSSNHAAGVAALGPLFLPSEGGDAIGRHSLLLVACEVTRVQVYALLRPAPRGLGQSPAPPLPSASSFFSFLSSLNVLGVLENLDRLSSLELRVERRLPPTPSSPPRSRLPMRRRGRGEEEGGGRAR